MCTPFAYVLVSCRENSVVCDFYYLFYKSPSLSIFSTVLWPVVSNRNLHHQKKRSTTKQERRTSENRECRTKKEINREVRWLCEINLGTYEVRRKKKRTFRTRNSNQTKGTGNSTTPKQCRKGSFEVLNRAWRECHAQSPQQQPHKKVNSKVQSPLPINQPESPFQTMHEVLGYHRSWTRNRSETRRKKRPEEPS